MTPTRAVVGAVVRAELTRLARDRTAAFFFILVPFLVILLVGLSFSGEAVSSLSIGVTAPDTPLAARVVERLDDADALSVQAFDDEADLQQAVRRQTVLAGVVVPADHDARTVEGAARVAAGGAGRLDGGGVAGTGPLFSTATQEQSDISPAVVSSRTSTKPSS